MSKVSRRKFIGSAALAVGVSAVLDSTALGQIRQIGNAFRGTDRLAELGWDSFLPFVNTDFAFNTRGRGGNSIWLRLVDMTDSRPPRSRSRKLRQDNFILKFAGEDRAPLKDGTYSVKHFNLGDFDLFITAAGQDDGLYLYSAVINRVTVTER